MKRIAIFVAPLILVLSLAVATVAVGEPELLPLPRDLTAERAKIECQKKQLDADDARNKYRSAKEVYDQLVALNAAGAGADEDRRKAQIAMINADIDARRKQLEADNCFAALKNDPDKDCQALIAKLYLAQDLLPLFQKLEELTGKSYTRAQDLAQQRAIGADDLRTARDATLAAVNARKRAELEIQGLELDIKMIAGCWNKVKTPEERKKAELPPEGGQPPTSVTSAPEELPTTITAQPTVASEPQPAGPGSPTATTTVVPLP